MNKRSIKLFLLLGISLLLLIPIGVYIYKNYSKRKHISAYERDQEYEKWKRNQVYTFDSINSCITKEPFLKNSTYTYSLGGDDPKYENIYIYDYSYTPIRRYAIHEIILKIDLENNIAIAYHPNAINHKILSIDYDKDNYDKKYHFGDNREGYPDVVITTDKGYILMKEPLKNHELRGYDDYQYHIEILYENLWVFPILACFRISHDGLFN